MLPPISSFLGLVFAPVCLGCSAALGAGGRPPLICGRCRSRLGAPPAPACERCDAPLLMTGRSAGATCPECAAWPEELSAARTAVLLKEPADRLVHQLKYRGWSGLAAPLGRLMADAWWGSPPAPFRGAALAAVVPVPTTVVRLRSRGYNQAALLAEAFARELGAPCLELLARATSRGSQTSLQPAARRANVAGNFQPREGLEGGVTGGAAVLIDDVLTTGATAGECARVLARCGAGPVAVVTFARALAARRIAEDFD